MASGGWDCLPQGRPSDASRWKTDLGASLGRIIYAVWGTKYDIMATEWALFLLLLLMLAEGVRRAVEMVDAFEVIDEWNLRDILLLDTVSGRHQETHGGPCGEDPKAFIRLSLGPLDFLSVPDTDGLRLAHRLRCN